MELAVSSNVDEILTGMVLHRARVQLGAPKLVRHWGARLQTQVKANAQGRPGPRMQTGDYNRSIGLAVVFTGAAFEAHVGTNRPQGRRLELGFRGTDSLGRRYDQPPYPHFGPAIDKIRPGFEAAISDLVSGW